jgi:DegV family protein with EDD domain
VVKIVTDSTSDIPTPIAEALGITIVPAYVIFGDKAYRDRVDIGEDELYGRLVEGPVHPTTSTPPPGAFTELYRRLAEESDEIVSIVVSSKKSALYEAALLGKEAVKKKCRIEVIDSLSGSMGLGLITMAAAKTAQAGGSIEEVVKVVRHTIPKTHLLVTLDTTKYASRGGRLGKAVLSLGAILRVKLILTTRDGDLVPAGMTRTRDKAIERLYEFVKKHLPVEDLAIMYSTTPKDAQSLAERVESLIPKKQPLIARLGPALGVHAGPGALVVALREK